LKEWGVSLITALEAHDIRFPTSRELDGSDAMNPDPDYSAAYVILRTDAPSGLTGHGFVFTIGRGNDVQTAAFGALGHLVVGRHVEDILADLGAFARSLTSDSQLRWLGPEKGVMHMAIGAVINAAWDMAARVAGKPVWQLIAQMSPQQIVDLIDFRYISDALSTAEALEILRAALPGRQQRTEELLKDGYPAYTTSPGWLGYSDEKLARLSREAIAEGFHTVKIKVGHRVEDDVRRCRIARDAIGPSHGLAIDANQRWDVPAAIAWLRQLQSFDIAWIEEPTSPDDVLGHAAIRRGIAPMPVSTGEHTHNRVMFKQLFQAHAVDLIQIDAARVGGVNENLAILLMAAKFGVRVYPHAGGVGLCELVQHLAMADYVAISGSMEDRAIEYVDHLHQHFVDPVRMRHGRYLAPSKAGFSAEMVAASLTRFAYPDGAVWRESAP
jgi:L-fuconate dehydratase